MTFATGASSSTVPTAVGGVAGGIAFTQAMYDDIDSAIVSIKGVTSDQLFVGGRVDLLWKQVEAHTNVVQVHGAAIQGLQNSPASGTYPQCKVCGDGDTTKSVGLTPPVGGRAGNGLPGDSSEEENELMAALPTTDPDEMLATVTKWKSKFNRGGGGGASTGNGGSGTVVISYVL